MRASAIFRKLFVDLRCMREQEAVEEILTPSNVAVLLKIHLQTVYRLAAEGKIPGNRIGRSWRFNRADILELISNNQTKPPGKPNFGRQKGHKRVSGNENDAL